MASLSGAWQHVAFTYDNTSIANDPVFYINGAVAVSVDGTPSGSPDPDAANVLTIGGRTSGAQSYDGQIDEVRIYNRILSATEIESLYKLGSGTHENAADSQQDKFQRGLSGYWKLDEGTGTSITADSSTNGNTLTMTNLEVGDWTTGQILSALDFDGVDEYLTVADPASGVLDFNDTDNFTLTGWFNRDTFAADHTLVAKRNGQAAGDTGYVVYVDDTNDDVVFEVSDGTDEYSRTSTTAFTATGYHHYAAVWRDGVGMEIYIDGALNQDAASGTLANIGSLANAVAFRIGAES